MRNKRTESKDEPIEFCVVGDLNDNETDLCDKLLDVPHGGECTIYFDSPGGSPYTAISLMTLILMRRVKATGIVTGECSSSALWPFAACSTRVVTPYSYLLFHPMKSQSEEQMGLEEAAEWSRHFAELEQEMDQVLAKLLNVTMDQLMPWMKPGRYVSGRELSEAGLAEMVELHRVD
jgi:ATP-dependent protease ClpP protease subunit